MDEDTDLVKNLELDSLDVVNRESVYDVGIAAYLLNPLKSSYNKDDLARDYLDMLLSPEDRELALEAYIYLQSKDILLNKLEESQMKDLYLNIEMPLVYILHDMEKSGIRVDAVALKEYGDNLSVSIDKLKGEILDEMGADDSFNLNSPKQCKFRAVKRQRPAIPHLPMFLKNWRRTILLLQKYLSTELLQNLNPHMRTVWLRSLKKTVEFTEPLIKP